MGRRGVAVKEMELEPLQVEAWPEPVRPVFTWAEAREDYKRGECVSKPLDVATYCRKYIGGSPIEAFLVLFLDPRDRVVSSDLMQTGTIDHAAIYPREIMVKALAYDATGIILCHNHPAGSLSPSEPDRQLTRQINDAARPLGVTLHDHLIVAHEGSFSFRQAGLL
jgi:DNA repair protein RadC